MKKNLLTKKNILHLGKLAKLTLTDEEIEKYLRQLEETVEYVENLNELDTKNVSPTSQIINAQNVFFKDGEKNLKALNRADGLKNAKNKKNSFFVVKRIL